MPQPVRLVTSICAVFLVILVFMTYSYRSFQQTQAPQDARPRPDGVDWSKFAYFQYATNLEHLCNSAMMFERLHSLDSKASLLLVYTNRYSPDGNDDAGFLLRKMRDQFKAVLKPVDVLHKDTDDSEFAPIL